MCSKPNSLTPFSVFSLTSSAREANDVSSNAPVKVRKVQAKTDMSLSWTLSLQSLPSGVTHDSPDKDDHKSHCLPQLTPVRRWENLNGQHLEARWLNSVLICVLNK